MRMNRTAKLCFYNARKRDGDARRIASKTGYSVSHVVNIMNGRRSVNDDIANEMHRLSRHRTKNSVK
jgi:hypothetical protein